MQVVNINYSKSKEVFEVVFEDETKLLLNYNIFEKYKVSVDMYFSEDEILEMKYFSDIERAKSRAINYISGKLKTKYEVRLKLKENGFAEDVIDEVLDILEKEEYLNDKVYCEIFIEDKKKLNGYGKNKIKSLLIQKGISKNIFEDFLNEFEYDEEFDNALKMGIKKLELLSNEEDNFKKKQKIINYLTYRGFGFDVINDVLKEIL
ncbi:regulatory protein RecX [Parvimonas micra]|jgi:recX family|uniref:Regulatory protein RecX n=1 Tax=Parvimonas micra TaxID=33033 RepID=A0A3B7DI40_9FIRM|nr:regulatory protein RecX [Parvimonas micra]AXU10763.1 regulatory protein RecX [Parvimonas micra]MBF1307118.1 regulatory protein RecX [Parvimonas micra]MCK6130823.1 recombination regulator RecX [Parvimonas micra]MCK6136468.1 recombination regulator RecX [Parvimonas micra]MCK6137939.1 recombination regulator RecX [Parvimonas micra]